MWWNAMVKKHGERLFFMLLALFFALLFLVFGWIEVPVKQGPAAQLFGSGITILIGLAMLCYNKARGPAPDESGNQPAPDSRPTQIVQRSQSGKVNMKTILLLFMICLSSLFVYSGCATNNPTATQQLMTQDADPMTVSLGVYYDGLKLYVDAQETYKPYQEFVKETNPDIDAEIIGYFREARKVLTDWKTLGVLPPDDERTFREALRDISLSLAKYLQTP